jgi:hypothetical protein
VMAGGEVWSEMRMSGGVIAASQRVRTALEVI